MEAIYLQKEGQSEFVTENVKLSSYFKKFSEDLEKYYIENEQEQHFFERMMGMDKDEFKLMNNKTSLKHLLSDTKKASREVKLAPPIEGFRADFKDYHAPDDVTELKSLQIVKKRTEKDLVGVKKKVKYVGEFDLEGLKIPSDNDNSMKDLTYWKDYVLSLRIYLPCSHSKFTSDKLKALQVNEELLVLGAQTLDILRDRIACPVDLQCLDGDVSDNPIAITNVIAKDKYKSAMFYIGNCFYIDGRHPDNIDYSEPIRKWAKTKCLDLKEVKFMETSTLEEMEFRLGYPYLYVHQGNCEHLIIFTDARLLHPRDLAVNSFYPVIKSFSNLRGSYCMACGTRVTRFIVEGSNRFPSDVTYLCTVCLYLYNYIDDKKIEDFKVYKHIDRVAIF